MNKTSQLVWLYIKRRPFLKQLVFEGVVNYSSLARKICIEGFGDLKKFDAVKMALQRLSSKLSKKEEGIEEKVLQVLRKSSITIKNKVAVVLSSNEIEETMNLITIESSEDIEDTPGVVSLILNSLAFEGINIVEFISCYTDTLLVVNEADTTKAYEVLNSLMSN